MSLKLQLHASDATGYGEVRSCVGTAFCSPQWRSFQLNTFGITFMIPLCLSSHLSELSHSLQKISVLWDITTCNQLNVNRRFGEKHRLRLQDRRISQVRNQKAGSKQIPFLARLILQSWRWSWYVPPKRRLNLNGPHGVISLKIECFIITAVRISNPTCPFQSCFPTSRSWDSSVGVVTGQQRNAGLIPLQGPIDFSLVHTVHTGSGAHPASV
jgi:hypothetical protein